MRMSDHTTRHHWEPDNMGRATKCPRFSNVVLQPSLFHVPKLLFTKSADEPRRWLVHGLHPEQCLHIGCSKSLCPVDSELEHSLIAWCNGHTLLEAWICHLRCSTMRVALHVQQSVSSGPLYLAVCTQTTCIALHTCMPSAAFHPPMEPESDGSRCGQAMQEVVVVFLQGAHATLIQEF